ncbi:MAG: dephospho-CoA kinase [Planctomycetota bacterium]|nr:MAG: dephospho-CoA kinase [Planctomycetota bacterium]
MTAERKGDDGKMQHHAPLIDRTGRTLDRGIIVGVAGPIAAGKSTASLFLAGLGAIEIDVDALAHQLLHEPEVIRELVEAFGEDVLDAWGRPDRWKLGRRAFADERSISELNRILHPRLIERLEEEIRIAREQGVMLVVNAALLFEMGLDEFCDYIITIVADPDVREHRAITKRGWPRGEMARRESYHLPLEEKLRKSDFIVENNGSYDELQRKLAEIYKEILDGEKSQDQPQERGGEEER